MNKNLFLFIVIIGFIIYQFLKQNDDEAMEVDIKAEILKVDKLLEVANSYKGVFI